MPRASRRTLTLSLLALACPALQAEPTALEPLRVESSTIDDRSGGRGIEPSSVAIIDGETVDRSHAENLQKLLQAIPGITTEVQGGDSIKIHIRGVENQRFMGEKPGVAIVIDGVPVFERTGRVNIDLDNIESVKVIKGGASFLFGEDALSGAVIITTKRGLQNNLIEGEAGRFGYNKALARAAGQWGDVVGHVQVSSRQANGYWQDAGYRADYLDGKLQWFVDESSDLTFGFERSLREKDSHGTVDGVTQAERDPQSREGQDYARKYDVALGKLFLNYNKDFGASTNLLVNAYRFTDHTRYISGPQRFDAAGRPVNDPNAYTNGTDQWQVQQGLKSELRGEAGRFAWLGAIDARFNTYDSLGYNLVDYRSFARGPVQPAGKTTSDNTTKETVAAAYGELRFRATDDLVLTANLRQDSINLDYNDHRDGLTLDRRFNVSSWRIGANYALGAEHGLYANVSTGFRLPTIGQLFAGTIDPQGGTASNADLNPEKAINKEIGLRGHLTLGIPLHYEAALFQIDRSDYIVAIAGQYAVADSGQINRYENVGGARSRGLELSLNGIVTPQWSFDLAYTLMDTEYTRSANYNLLLGDRWGKNYVIEHHDLLGHTLPRTPKHHLNLRAHYRPLADLQLTAELDTLSGYYADELNRLWIGGHSVVNLLAGYDIKSGPGVRWSLFARIDNLFDRRYYNTARATYDANANGRFDPEDMSLVVNPGIVWTVGVGARF
ncbi:MAG: TonB-dependent receptor [Halothiobacillaceae bacterium]|jgi:iron complex outermembrane receptor protein|nr:TonB-dependent receptor [Halothiobacillaceae bacterium]